MCTFIWYYELEGASRYWKRWWYTEEKYFFEELEDFLGSNLCIYRADLWIFQSDRNCKWNWTVNIWWRGRAARGIVRPLFVRWLQWFGSLEGKEITYREEKRMYGSQHFCFHFYRSSVEETVGIFSMIGCWTYIIERSTNLLYLRNSTIYK